MTLFHKYSKYQTPKSGIAKVLTALAVLCFESILLAQESTKQSAEETVRNVLEDHPIISARSASLSGALVTGADDLDSTYINPAGIGGLNWGKQKVPWVRKLYFPWGAASANQNSIDLVSGFQAAGGSTDRVIGKSVLAAHEGKRQYARFNMMPGLVFGRTALVPINDLQVAATTRADDPLTADIDESALVNGHFRSQSGFGAGVSGQTPDGSLSLGYFGYTVNRTDVEGDFNYDDMLETAKRSDALSEVRSKSSGSGHHVGFIWRIGKAWSPTLGVSIKDLGGTTFAAKSPDFSNVRVLQNTSMGLTFGPDFKSGGGLKLTLQGDRLEDPDVALAKKYRMGTELSFGGFGSYALFALRAGASQAGPSAGVALNLGLIGFNAGFHSIDIGAGNQKVVETRAVADAFVNVAEF